MVRSLVACGLVAFVTLGCGDDDGDTTDADPTDAATTDTAATDVAGESGDLDAWCLGWNAEAQDSGDLQVDFEAGLARTAALLDVAPDEIAGANASMLDAQQTLADHLAEHDWDPTAPRLAPELVEDPLREAGEAMETFAAERC